MQEITFENEQIILIIPVSKTDQSGHKMNFYIFNSKTGCQSFKWLPIYVQNIPLVDFNIAYYTHLMMQDMKNLLYELSAIYYHENATIIIDQYTNLMSSQAIIIDLRR